MQEKAQTPARKDLNEDFPLRSAVRCPGCDNPQTCSPLFKTATKMFEAWWNYRQARIAQRGQALEDEIRKLDAKSNN